MNKRFIIPTLSICILSVCCSKTEDPDPKPQPTSDYPQTPENPCSFSIRFSDSLRTKVCVEDSRRLVWEEEDSVRVYGLSETPEIFRVDSSGKVSTVTLNRQIPQDRDYIAVSPHNYGESFAEDGSMVFNVPSSQMPVPGKLTYNPSLAFTSGKDRDFRFQTLCGMISFNITRDDIVSVTVAGRANEEICGNMCIDCSKKDASYYYVTQGKTNITLSKGGGCFEVGQYYVSIIPTDFHSGLIFSMTNSAGEVGERICSTPYSIERGRLYDAADIDKTKGWGGSYHIFSNEQFISFLEQASSYDQEMEVTLSVDVDLEGAEVGEVSSFKGKLNGSGHKIMNWVSSHPLFGMLEGEISDLEIDSSCSVSTDGQEDIAVFVRNNKGLISGCVNKASLSVDCESLTARRAIGSMAAINSGQICECKNYGAISLVAGQSGTKTTSSNPGATQFIGGVVGRMEGVDGSGLIDSCENYGSVTDSIPGICLAQTFIGGVLGGTTASLPAAWPTSNKGNVNNCTNGGKVMFTYSALSDCSSGSNYPFVGGVAGTVEGNVSYCTNKGPIYVICPKADDGESKSYFVRGASIGGVVGAVSGNMNNCSNNAEINISATFANADSSMPSGMYTNTCIGGVFGQAGGTVSSSFASCSNSGKMKIDAHMRTANGSGIRIGGVCGITLATVSDLTNSGEMEITSLLCTTHCGGVIGEVLSSSTKDIIRCSNSGKITLDAGENASAKQSNTVYVGGVIGAHSVTASNYTYRFGDNSGDIVVTGGLKDKACNVGGIVGNSNKLYINKSGNEYADDNVINSGNITVNTPAQVYVGGISGRSDGNGQLWYAQNIGTIDVTCSSSNAVYVGGMRGSTNGQLHFCNNTGKIKVDGSSDSYVGGIAALTGATQNVRCENRADIEFIYSGSSPETHIAYLSPFIAKINCYCTVSGYVGGTVSASGTSNIYKGALTGNAYYNNGTVSGESADFKFLVGSSLNLCGTPVPETLTLDYLVGAIRDPEKTLFNIENFAIAE